jgi:hypothetical protein
MDAYVGESDIYREEIFQFAFSSLCALSSPSGREQVQVSAVDEVGGEEESSVSVSVSVSPQAESREAVHREVVRLPRQLGLTREKLLAEWLVLDTRRVEKLIMWRDDFISLQKDFNRRSKKKRFRVINEYEEYVEATCSGIHNILKNSANEENDKRHRSGRNSELDQVTVQLKKLCFDTYSDIANTREDIYLASQDGVEQRSDAAVVEERIAIAEKFRAAMSSGYDLINFASEVKAYSPKVDAPMIFSEIEIFAALDRIGEELLPKLKKHLPSNLEHRGMYYEFKYYEFLSIALTENDRGDDIMDALANAINLWRTLHIEHKYYGTDYDAIDKLREGWTIISKYGLMACSEATGVLTQLGVDSLKDSIKLLETTFAGDYYYYTYNIVITLYNKPMQML